MLLFERSADSPLVQHTVVVSPFCRLNARRDNVGHRLDVICTTGQCILRGAHVDPLLHAFLPLLASCSLTTSQVAPRLICPYTAAEHARVWGMGLRDTAAEHARVWGMGLRGVWMLGMRVEAQGFATFNEEGTLNPQY